LSFHKNKAPKEPKASKQAPTVAEGCEEREKGGGLTVLIFVPFLPFESFFDAFGAFPAF
jgi:hypothetical protein